jgi:hypothetical protein
MDGGLGSQLGGGLASTPANLTGGLLHTDLDTSLSSMEYELVESMAGSGGGSGSSGTALGGTLASTADAHEGADSKVKRRLAFSYLDGVVLCLEAYWFLSAVTTGLGKLSSLQEIEHTTWQKAMRGTPCKQASL